MGTGWRVYVLLHPNHNPSLVCDIRHRRTAAHHDGDRILLQVGKENYVIEQRTQDTSMITVLKGHYTC